MIFNKILSVLYYLFCIVSAIVVGLATILNIIETIAQLLGHTTLFNQITTMSNPQILFYCLVSTSILIFTTTLLIKYLLKKERIKAVLTSSLGWIIIISMFVIEDVYRFVV